MNRHVYLYSNYFMSAVYLSISLYAMDKNPMVSGAAFSACLFTPFVGELLYRYDIALEELEKKEANENS